MMRSGRACGLSASQSVNSSEKSTVYMTTQPTILYLPHGGGPLPLLGDPAHAELIEFLKQWPQAVSAPQEIVLISAHWEAQTPRITGSPAPALIYDYNGFPPEAYEILYPAPGSPALAARVRDALQGAGLSPEIDATRGYDHGMFVPLKLMYPQAQIPCVQVSLLESLDPAQHWALGEALSAAISEHTLVIGSGLSFHNLSVFRSFDPALIQHAQQFDNWLVDTCTNDTLDAIERKQRLTNWSQAPAARICHPREEHLLPCHVCAGVANGKPARAVYRKPLRGKAVSALQW